MVDGQMPSIAGFCNILKMMIFTPIRRSGVLRCDKLVKPANAAKDDESLLICYTQRTVG